MAKAVLDSGGNFRNDVQKRFGRLTVVGVAGKTARGATVAKCLCDCGTAVDVQWTNLQSGGSQSCGCLRREITALRALKHGHNRNRRVTAELSTWKGMLQRCYYPKSISYKNYGGLGIKVCDRWRLSFAAFLEDIGPRPSPQHSLDRFPNEKGDYEPGNVRWATRAEQARNTRRTTAVTFNGLTLCVEDWSVRTGISQSTLCRRIKAGWSIERALTTPVCR